MTGTPPIGDLGDPAAALAARFGRATAVLTAGGAAALEAALRWSGVGPGDEVLVPDTGCYKIAAAVVRERAIPVFVGVGRALVLEPEAVAAALSGRTRAVVCVHQYGLIAPIRSIRNVLPEGVAVLEDAAQAWDSRSEGRGIGRVGDATVLSFGPSKPVPVGAGGAVLGDDPRLDEWIGSDAPGHRMLPVAPTPAPFPAPLLPVLAERMAAADAAVVGQRRFVEALAPLFDEPGFSRVPTNAGDQPSWHRVPIWCADERSRQRLLRAADSVRLRAYPEHEVELPALPMFARVGRHVPHGAGTGARLVVLTPAGGPQRAEQFVSAATRASTGAGS